MKVEIARPPNFAEIAEKFSLRRGVIFTYGGTIFNPDDVAITQALQAHETVHSSRQVDPAAWWARYLVDRDFRYEEELMAHRMEFYVLAGAVKDRNARDKHLNSVVFRFTSPIYKLGISVPQARREILRGI